MCVCAYIYLCLYIDVWILGCSFICTYVLIYIYMLTCIYTYTLVGPPFYQQFKFKTVAIRNPTQANMVGMQEFRFFDSAGIPIIVETAMNPGGEQPGVLGVHTPNKLIDGIVIYASEVDAAKTSKWLDMKKSNVIFTFASLVRVASYEWVTCEDLPDRDPVSWEIEGQVTIGDAWTLLQRVSNYPTTSSRSATVRFQIWPSEGKYTYVCIFM